MQEIQVQILGQEDSLEKEMATHSSILAGKYQGWRSVVGYSPFSHKRGLGSTKDSIFFPRVVGREGEGLCTPL